MDFINKTLYDYLLNNTGKMLSVISKDYRYVKVNRTFCRLHGKTEGDIEGKTLSGIWGEEVFRDRIKENIDNCFKGNIVKYEAEFPVPLSGKRYFEVVFNPLKDEKGRLNYLLAETTDVTELRLTRKALGEMEEEFRKFRTSLPVGLLRCKPDGTIVYYNKAFSDMLENPEGRDLTGRNLKDFYSEKSLFDLHLLQLGEDKIRSFGRVPMITCKGTIIMCRSNGFLSGSESDSTAGFIDLAFEDSSREIMLENRLMQAKKLETIGSLAGGIAHDFNNILASVFGYSELLLEDVRGNQSATEITSRIIRAVTRARELTNQILTFSRQVEQEKIPVNICGVVDEAVDYIASLKKPGITITQKTDSDNQFVNADPTQLFRVFMNLMTNAVQAMEKSGGTLTIGVSRVSGDELKKEVGSTIVADEYVLVTVEDTGTGMDESVVSRIFEPYFTTREIGKGTGLGLSVVYGIVTELGGTITVRSEKNKGSIFSVYLPLMDEDSMNQIIPEKELGKILYFSGECHESRILSAALAKRGYRIDYASGIEGLATFADNGHELPDVIIYSYERDNIDPAVLSGFLEGKAIDIPVILVADIDHDLSKEKLLNSGLAKIVLIKPVSLREMLSAIKIILNK